MSTATPILRMPLRQTMARVADAGKWREARPILAWLCLIGGLLSSILGMVAGTALVFAGVYWLFVEVTT